MSRSWPIPRLDRTIHIVGDTQAISTGRKAIVLSDLAKSSVPDVSYRVQVGDLIGGTGDPALFPAAIDFLNNMGSGQWWACVGNHDYDYLDFDPTPQSAAAAMGMPGVNFVIDMGFVVCLFTYVRAEAIWDENPYDPTWLDETLSQYGDRVCIIIAHPTLENTPNPENVTPDRDLILDVLAKHPNAKAWICGHTHNPIEAPGLVKIIGVGGRDLLHIDASAIHYTIPNVDWTDRLITMYLTVEDDRLEVRFRDHGAHQWIGGSSEHRRVWSMHLRENEA